MPMRNAPTGTTPSGPSGPSRPSGTVTFLFTDIEGSTKRWDASPQQMSLTLSRHDAILAAAIEQQGGYVFKTVGDAFCAAFSTPLSALQAALEVQTRLATELPDISVRAALHTGMAEERGGDYFGPTLNRVARLLSAGHGGQTLLSGPTHDLVRDYLPQGTSLLDMGEHRLKDLARPEHIFQLVAPGLRSEFPPLRTLNTRPNNLPRQTTPLIGREKEIEAVCSLLCRPGVALVTLTGPGGIGKTRLALQTAAEALDDFPDGAWFVELAALNDPDLVISTIARTLGVTEAPGKALVDTLKDYLKDKHLLLVLDNFEQVMAASRAVAAIVRAAPDVKVLVTSRVRLNVYGEQEFVVPALSLPDVRPGHLPDLKKVSEYDAVRLFIERGQAAKAGFEVTNENAPAVVEICARLDGLPLAIELAAARLKMLPPQALLSRLSSRLKILTGGARDLPVRQQTLRGAIEWSYDLLDDGEKQLFRRMAVFSGGRTLEAIEAVCNSEALHGEGQLAVEVLDGVQSLLDKSLLQQREGRDGEPRFWMLETIHEYADEKLQESGEADELHSEHALYFMRLAEEAEPHLARKEQVEWLNRLEEEHDNLRAALGWAAERGTIEAIELGLRIGGAISQFWELHGHLSEGRERLAGLLANPRANTDELRASRARARALSGAGRLAGWQGDSASARALHEESLAIYKELEDKRGIAMALNGIGLAVVEQGDYTSARALHEESLALRREIGDRQGMATSLSNLGYAAKMQGDYASARALYSEGLAIRKELGDKQGTALSLNGLGILALVQGEYGSARNLFEQSLAIRRELGDKLGIAHLVGNLGIIAQMQGDYTSARALQEESLVIRKEIGDKQGTAMALNNLGNIAFVQGDYASAQSLFRECLELVKELGTKYGVAASLGGLGGAMVGREGGEVQEEGAAERGVRLLGAAGVLLEALGTELEPDDRMPYEQGIASARTLLGEEAFEKAWQEGHAMSVEAAIEYALERTPNGA